MLENYPNLQNYFKLNGFFVAYVNVSTLTDKLIIDLDSHESIKSTELIVLINDFGLIQIRDEGTLRLLFDINQIN